VLYIWSAGSRAKATGGSLHIIRYLRAIPFIRLGGNGYSSQSCVLLYTQVVHVVGCFSHLLLSIGAGGYYCCPKV
jgi:hypothetical protein